MASRRDCARASERAGLAVALLRFPGLFKNRTSAERDLFVAHMQAFKLDPNNVAACIEFETGGTWSTTIRNKTTDAVGLIGFMPQTAKALGTTVDELAAMTFEHQLGYVVRYFQAVGIDRLKRPVDYYAAVFYPAAIGTDDAHVIASAGSPVYAANSGLDRHKLGRIATSDLRETIESKLRQAGATGLAEPSVIVSERDTTSSVIPALLFCLPAIGALAIFALTLRRKKR